MFQRQTLFVLVALLFATTGCQNGLKLKDRDSLSPGGRISYEVYPGIDTRREGALLDLVSGPTSTTDGEPVTVRSAGIRPTFSVDGEVAQVRGHDHQPLRAGAEVELGDATILGPDRLGLRADNVRINMAGRGGVRFFDVLSIEGILGTGIDHTKLRVSGDGVASTRSSLRPGILYGGRATLRPIPLFDIYTQYTGMTWFTETTTQDWQVGAELNLTRNVSVYGGYRWFDYERSGFLSSGSDIESDIDAEMSGPMVGLSLKF